MSRELSQKTLEVERNLRAADWKNLKLWGGDSVDQIEVRNRGGMSCGILQISPDGFIKDMLTMHNDLILRAARFK